MKNVNAIKGLEPVEKVVINHVLLFLNKIEELKQLALDYLDNDNLIKAKDMLQSCRYLEHNVEMHKMKNDVIEHCSVETLLKIINEQKFDTMFSQILIPKSVLPNIPSSTKIYGDDPKASIYRALGVQIIQV